MSVSTLATAEAPPPPARPAYYPALTGLRAVAAYLVFFLHFRFMGQPDWLVRLTGQGYVGVGMFFVLSGFVIATRYQGTVRLTRAWWGRYLWRRVARIYPVYFLLNGWALSRLYWPLPPGQAGNSLFLIALSQSMLRGFSNTLKFVGLPQGWSLTVEECFYLSAPLLLLLWQRRGWTGAAGFAALLASSGLLLTALCAGRPELHGLFGSYRHLCNFTFFGRVLEFVLGVGLARWWASRPAAANGRGTWRTLAGALAMALAIGLLAALRSPIDTYDGLRYPAAIATNILLFPAAVALLLAGLLSESTRLRQVLASRLAQALGRSSYFFYLLHVSPFSVWWQQHFGWGRHILLQFAATVLLSELGYRLLEQPVHRWLLACTKAAPQSA
ncbi:MAG: acyltransferase family protein [Janthinobacterium lividum]